MGDGKNIEDRKKFTNLLLYRQYSTYQVLLEAYPKNGLSVRECYSKVVLYIMNWFKNRLGAEVIENVEEVKFLKDTYPLVEQYEDFDISRVPDINRLSVVDVKTAYIEEDNGWVFELVEPDNGNEQKDIKGRTFITQILAYLRDKTVVFGVRTTCKEPAHNTEDADVYRPGFIKAINSDPDIELSEEGIPYEYRFADVPIIINGKSSQECSAIYTGLIANPKRQLPVVFIPESLYEKDEETKQMLNGRTRSYLGFAHVIVCTRSNQKLFRNEMNDLELLEVLSEGQVILYRSNPRLRLVVEPMYFDPDEEDAENAGEIVTVEKENIDEVLDAENLKEDKVDNDSCGEVQSIADSDEPCSESEDYDNENSEKENDSSLIADSANEEGEFEKLDLIVKKSDPLRRNYDFGEYSFTAKVWDPQKLMESIKKEGSDSEQVKAVLAENDSLRVDIEEKKRDNAELQRRITEYELGKKRIEQQYYEASASAARMEKIAGELKDEYEKVKDRAQRYESTCLTYEKIISGAKELAREKFRPLLHFPKFEMSAKEEMLDWLEEHYSDILILHPNARKSFMKDNRNLDWRCICMMLHYLAGYTLYRREGGAAINSDAARDYDPDEYGFVCEPVSSGSGGSKNMYEDKYTIDISAYNRNKNDVVMDMHIAQGKGRGVEMVRIYFYYDPEIKRSIIGYMPGHLPTRNDPH